MDLPYWFTTAVSFVGEKTPRQRHWGLWYWGQSEEGRRVNKKCRRVPLGTSSLMNLNVFWVGMPPGCMWLRGSVYAGRRVGYPRYVWRECVCEGGGVLA